MAASSPHRSAAPHLQTPRSPRDDSAATCGDAAFCARNTADERSAFGRKLTSPGLPQPCRFTLGLGGRQRERLANHKADPGVGHEGSRKLARLSSGVRSYPSEPQILNVPGSLCSLISGKLPRPPF